MSRFFRKKFLYNFQFTGRFKAIQNEKVNFSPLLTQITCVLRHFVSSGNCTPLLLVRQIQKILHMIAL